MDETQQSRRVRMTPFTRTVAPTPDDPDLWVGGEASVGSQAGRHIRQSERNRPGSSLMILGLAFVGGVALGAVASSFLGKRSR